MRNEVLKNLHDHESAGHLGFSKTYQKVNSRYFWPGMKKDVKNWIRTCDARSRKKGVPKSFGLLQSILPPDGAFQMIGMDIMGPLLETLSGNKFIIVFSDYLTKYVENVALKKIDTESVAKVLVENVILRHGAPLRILSDRASNFLSELANEVYKLFQIKKLSTTSYHPQTNSLVERFNRTMTEMLSMFVNDEKNNWDILLPYITFAYNTSAHESTKISPFKLVYCREPVLPIDAQLMEEKILHSGNDFKKKLKLGLEAREKAKLFIEKNQVKQKEYYDKERINIQFEVEDMVWLNNPVAKKLDVHWFGPYEIVEKITPLLYRLKLPNSSRTHDVVHISRLKKCNDEPLRIDDDQELSVAEEEFEVERILDKKRMKSNDGKTRVYYLIKWKGYDSSFNTWEPGSNLGNAKEAIKEFEQKQKQKYK